MFSLPLDHIQGIWFYFFAFAVLALLRKLISTVFFKIPTLGVGSGVAFSLTYSQTYNSKEGSVQVSGKIC